MVVFSCIDLVSLGAFLVNHGGGYFRGVFLEGLLVPSGGFILGIYSISDPKSEWECRLFVKKLVGMQTFREQMSGNADFSSKSCSQYVLFMNKLLAVRTFRQKVSGNADFS